MNNYEHLTSFGLGVVALVIAGEIAKPLLPLAMLKSSANHDTARFCAALTFWLVIVAFSFTNTLGNVVTRHAVEKARLGHVSDSVVRSEHVILKEIASLRECQSKVIWVKRTQTTVPDKACEEKNAAAKRALEAEIATAKKRSGTKDETPVGAYTVEDGYVTLAAFFGWYPKRHEIGLLVVLLWTLLAEFGSALGGLAIPARSKGE